GGVIGGATGRERRGRHVLVSAIEHPSVLEPARELALRGFEVEEVPCGPGGVVDPDDVRRRMRPDTVLVALIAVNNEVGTVQPVREAARLVHEAGALLHCDAAQAPGKVALDAFRDADFLTLSSHKAYGPKGAAALVVRSKGGFRPKPILFGGGQEEGLWPGTANVAAVAGFGRAMALAAARLEADRVRIAELCDVLVGGLAAKFPGSRRNGDPAATVPQCASVILGGVAGETVLSALARGGVAASFGSACATESNEPSHVLTAMGLAPAECRRTLRFGIGRFTTREEIEHVLAVIRGVGVGPQTPM
ncbi:MAG: aminotransferase class V-fold PLP-dependent enzyme, partial [Deltaproteobacteria bacterium]|nr:aminotransferase class V-fold PLP-dependent enzyme [Deltaproteobacteria bacterium]